MLVGAGKRAKPLPSICSMFIGPRFIKFGDTCPNQRYFMRRRLGPPGGAVCVGARDLAHCPRTLDADDEGDLQQ